MGLLERIDEIDREFYGLIWDDKLEEVIDFVLASIDEVIGMTGKYFTEKALPDLRFKFINNNWPHGGGCYSSDEAEIYERRQRVMRKRYSSEAGLLSAQNERRKARLWEETKEALEERYGRPFESREEVAIMNGMFKKRKEVEESIAELRKTLDRIRLYDETAARHPDQGWEEISAMWRRYRLRADVIEAAGSFIGFVKDLKRPEKLLKETTWKKDNTTWKGGYPKPSEIDEWAETEEDLDDLTDTKGHSCHVRGIRGYSGFMKSFQPYILEYLNAVVLAGKNGNLDFMRAMCLTNSSFGIDFLKPDSHKHFPLWNIGASQYTDLPDVVREYTDKAIKDGYKNMTIGDECFRAMRGFGEHFLKRWEKTGPDHNRLFDYFVPKKQDQDLMDLFYWIKDGEQPEHKDKRGILGRLPAVIRLLIDAGVVREEEVNPPLRNRYLLPDELRQLHAGKLLTDGTNVEEYLALEMEKKKAMIAIAMDTRKMLPDFQSNLPVPRDELDQLADLLNPEKDYYVLFKGNHTLFLAAEDHFPNGDLQLKDIRKIAMLKDDAEPSEGDVVHIKGQRFLVTQEKSLEERSQIDMAVLDANQDIVPVNCYTFVTDVSPEEFREKYFSDFMAHVFFNRPWSMSEKITEELGLIQKLSTTGFTIPIGPTENVQFRSFEVMGRYAFQLKAKDGWEISDVVTIAFQLKRYIESVGIGIHQEIDLDEHGRAEVQRKIKDRIFYQENFEIIKETLQGPKLAGLLASVAMDMERYKLSYSGQSKEPCKDCGAEYFGGSISRQDVYQHSLDGVWGSELHAISRHPETFKNTRDSLTKIKWILDNHDTLDLPIVLQHPELMQEFDAFAAAYEVYIKTESGDDWEEDSWLGTIEEEEKEDNPEIKARIAEKEETQKEFRAVWRKLDEKITALQKKYNTLQGIEEELDKDKEWERECFWQDQLFMFHIYRLAAPEQMEQFKEYEIVTNRTEMGRW